MEKETGRTTHRVAPDEMMTRHWVGRSLLLTPSDFPSHTDRSDQSGKDRRLSWKGSSGRVFTSECRRDLTGCLCHFDSFKERKLTVLTRKTSGLFFFLTLRQSSFFRSYPWPDTIRYRRLRRIRPGTVHASGNTLLSRSNILSSGPTSSRPLCCLRVGSFWHSLYPRWPWLPSGPGPHPPHEKKKRCGGGSTPERYDGSDQKLMIRVL